MDHSELSPANVEPENRYGRGMLVVDNTLSVLIPFLEDQQFSVLSLAPGMDDQIANPSISHELGGLLGERIFVTNRAEEFRHAAAVHGFSIIDTAGYNRDPESVAEEISEDWTQLQVRGNVPYILRLRRDGVPMLERVE